ncbi:hypothetical protein [Paracoccus litorisediminis]|uniref:Uncharacterized protein n=1 Tax=Paracoccus litorisediminis TaxID=2006130 RepID=A0A844HP53_9RHOB|nr:hypothetical protein [Paracoccus litorisediminis]MTH62153.1 hypothetical protein [Paracoccus litorisediminis]
MNWMDEYEAELAGQARAAIAAEDAAWNALSPAEKEAALAADRAKREAEDARQERIRQHHLERFGPDDEAEASTDGKAFIAAGFTLHHTGGGCMAWRKIIGTVDVLVTNDDGTSHIPDEDGYQAGIYDNDTCEEISSQSNIPTAQEAILIADEMQAEHFKNKGDA